MDGYVNTCQGLVVESIAFDRAYGGEGSTKAILLGTDQGQIYETSLDFSSSAGGGGSTGAASSASFGGGKERPLVKVRRSARAPRSF
jgi:hypothetical protein